MKPLLGLLLPSPGLDETLKEFTRDLSTKENTGGTTNVGDVYTPVSVCTCTEACLHVIQSPGALSELFRGSSIRSTLKMCLILKPHLCVTTHSFWPLLWWEPPTSHHRTVCICFYSYTQFVMIWHQDSNFLPTSLKGFLSVCGRNSVDYSFNKCWQVLLKCYKLIKNQEYSKSSAISEIKVCVSHQIGQKTVCR